MKRRRINKIKIKHDVNNVSLCDDLVRYQHKQDVKLYVDYLSLMFRGKPLRRFSCGYLVSLDLEEQSTSAVDLHES
jgi:hypothetical protein